MSFFTNNKDTATSYVFHNSADKINGSENPDGEW